jgi:hypothetical protein
MLTMSPPGLAQWKIALADLGIGNGSDLWREVNGNREQQDHVISQPTARDAFDGKASKNKWEIIFRELDLKWSDFFTEAAWNGWNRETLWGMLLNLSEDASDRFGMVFPDEGEEANIRNAIPLPNLLKYMTKLPINSEVMLEIPSGLSGHLILLEQNTKGGIDLVSPSPLMKNTLLAGEVQLLPQRPLPKGYAEKIHMTDVGTRYLWAGIFDRLPEWDWLADTQEEMRCDLQVEQLTDLLTYAKTQPPGTPIWRSSYTVTAAW